MGKENFVRIKKYYGEKDERVLKIDKDLKSAIFESIHTVILLAKNILRF